MGPLFNVYNEDTLGFVARRGAVRVTLPPELPAAGVAAMAHSAASLGVVAEALVYGRLPLALSARCYHARAHGRVKDNCEFVCGQDPDGMALATLDNRAFLVINGTQTLSYACLNLAGEMASMVEMGVDVFRLSPHSHDMVVVSGLFRDVLDGKRDPDDATARLAEAGLDAPFCNGFHHGTAGHEWVQPPAADTPNTCSVQ